MTVDYYHILDLESTASTAEIKTAFRTLAKKYHPDVNSSVDAADKFKKVYMAYEVLSDPFKKKMYDEMYLAAGLGNGNSHYHSDSYTHDNFTEWEAKARAREQQFAQSNYASYHQRELHGLTFLLNVIALLLGIGFFFILGGSILLMAVNLFFGILYGGDHWLLIILVFILGFLAFTILKQVLNMTKSLFQGIVSKIRKYFK